MKRADLPFRALLLLLPPDFRRRYGEEMAALHAARMDRAGREGRRLTAWSRSAGDVTITAFRERLQGRRHPGTRDGETRMGAVTTVLADAARRLMRAPGFTLVAVAIAALGIGLNVAAFSVVDAFLFRPPPWTDPDQVVRIYQDSDEGEPNSTSYPAYRDMAAMDHVFQAVAAATPADVTWEAEDGPVGLAADFVTASYLEVVGLPPFRGRWFEPGHDHPGAGYFAVLGHAAWTRHFGGDPGVVGTSLRLNGNPVTVIGVAPPALRGTFEPAATDIYLSISTVEIAGAFRVANLERREDHWYQVLARMAPGVGVPQAQAAMTSLATRLAEAFPEVNRGRDITVFAGKDVRLHPDADGGIAPVAGLLMAIVGLVLILACSNLANLLLVRGAAREGEVAVHQAMGAGRGRIAAFFLAESFLLAVAGGVGGILLARELLGVVALLPNPLPVSGEMVVGLDLRVMVFAVALILVTGLLFGMAPALRAARRNVSDTLRNDTRTASSGRGARLLRNGLVAVQVGASVVLLVGSSLLFRSFVNLTGTDPGVTVPGVAFLRTDLSPQVESGEEALALLDEVEARMAALPEVASVAATTRIPLENRGGSTTTIVEGYTPSTGTDAVELLYAYVGPGYFETLEIPVLEGRGFTRDDAPGSGRVVVLSRTAAERFWPGEDPIGRRTRPQSAPDTWFEVVGVVDDVKVRSLGEDPVSFIYFPLRQARPGNVTLVARGSTDAEGLAQAMGTALQAVRPGLAVDSRGTMEGHLGEALSGPRNALAALGLLALGALLLASLGIYGVVAFAVRRRNREMGIRLALGATARRVTGAVVGEVTGAVLLGTLVGLGLAIPMGGFLARELHQVRGTDPAAFAGAGLILLLVAATAAWLPARRATRADPVKALRAER